MTVKITVPLIIQWEYVRFSGRDRDVLVDLLTEFSSEALNTTNIIEKMIKISVPGGGSFDSTIWREIYNAWINNYDGCENQYENKWALSTQQQAGVSSLTNVTQSV